MVEKLLGGDVRALARCITMVEENAPGAPDILREVFPSTGRATVIGITGSPGAGKSSLVDKLLTSYRREGKRVGVVAVDPSSAYSGGAILGDRIRMQEHAVDSSVFIRSMATRGYLGGLSRASADAVDLMDAAGYDPIIVETVGVGQDEIDVVRASDVVCVVLVPGMGDDIQAIKAGILEIADLFVVNKADKPGVNRLIMDIEFMLSLAGGKQDRQPEILKTVAVKDEGIEELRKAIGVFTLEAGDQFRTGRRRERAEARFLAVLSERLLATVLEQAVGEQRLQQLVDRIAEREMDPYSAVETVLAQVEVKE
jgi:LAO/AO transport system kinase